MINDHIITPEQFLELRTSPPSEVEMVLRKVNGFLMRLSSLKPWQLLDISNRCSIIGHTPESDAIQEVLNRLRCAGWVVSTQAFTYYESYRGYVPSTYIVFEIPKLHHPFR